MGLPMRTGGVPGGEPGGALMRPFGPSHQHMAMSSSQTPERVCAQGGRETPGTTVRLHSQGGGRNGCRNVPHGATGITRYCCHMHNSDQHAPMHTSNRHASERTYNRMCICADAHFRKDAYMHTFNQHAHIRTFIQYCMCACALLIGLLTCATGHGAAPIVSGPISFPAVFV